MGSMFGNKTLINRIKTLEKEIESWKIEYTKAAQVANEYRDLYIKLADKVIENQGPAELIDRFGATLKSLLMPTMPEPPKPDDLYMGDASIAKLIPGMEIDDPWMDQTEISEPASPEV